MINIYLCDDEPWIRQEIETIIQRQILIHGYDMEIVRSTGKPEELLNLCGQDGGGCIYFLDVELKGSAMDGFELGKKIRALDGGSTIIYITSFANMAFRTFQYHIEAMDYIVKGDGERMRSSIAECLSEVVKRLEAQGKKGERAYYTIRFLDTVRQIPVDEIYYFETSPRAHKVILYASQETMEFPGNLTEIGDELGDSFFRSHRAYLINLKQVKELLLKENTLIMKDGSRCLVARNMKSRLLKLLTE